MSFNKFNHVTVKLKIEIAEILINKENIAKKQIIISKFYIFIFNIHS